MNIMKRKENVTVKQLLKLKERLIGVIKRDFKTLKYLNLRGGEDNDTKEKVEELFNDIEFYQEKLIEVKELLVTTNNKKHDGDSHTNNYYIYLLSNLTEELNFYVQLKAQASSPITQKEVFEKINSIQRKREQISNKLTNFNETKKVKLDLSDQRLKDLL